MAGAGLCDEPAVRTLVAEAPAAIAELQALGARLDLDGDGRPALTREGGHSRDRIVHAGGDASGAEVTRTLAAALQQVRRFSWDESARRLLPVLERAAAAHRARH